MTFDRPDDEPDNPGIDDPDAPDPIEPPTSPVEATQVPDVALSDAGESAEWLVDFTLPGASTPAAPTAGPVSFGADIFDSPPDEVVERLEDALDAVRLGPSLSVGADASGDAEKPSRFADLDAAFAPIDAGDDVEPPADPSTDDAADDATGDATGESGHDTVGILGLGPVGLGGSDDEDDDHVAALAPVGASRRRAVLTLALTALVGIVLFQLRDSGDGRRAVAASDVPETVVDDTVADDDPELLPEPEFELAAVAQPSSVDFTNASGEATAASEDLLRAALGRFGALSGTGDAGNQKVSKPRGGNRNKPVDTVPNSPTSQPPTTQKPTTTAKPTTTVKPTTTAAPTTTTTAPTTTTTKKPTFEERCAASPSDSDCVAYCGYVPSASWCPEPTTTTAPTTTTTTEATTTTATPPTDPPPSDPPPPAPEPPGESEG